MLVGRKRCGCLTTALALGFASAASVRPHVCRAILKEWVWAVSRCKLERGVWRGDGRAAWQLVETNNSDSESIVRINTAWLAFVSVRLETVVRLERVVSVWAVSRCNLVCFLWNLGIWLA